jgi:hypothetical protein
VSEGLGLWADDPGMQAAERAAARTRRERMLARWRTVSTRPRSCTDHGDRRGCGAPIRWVLTEESWMPLNPAPAPDGNVTVDRDGAAQIAHVLTAAELADPAGVGVRYTSHFATCPHASQHRRS